MRKKKVYHNPFRRAVLRGLGVVLPPLLTLLILIWLAKSVQQYVLEPVEWVSRKVVVLCMDNTQASFPEEAEFNPRNGGDASSEDMWRFENEVFVRVGPEQWIPRYIRDHVVQNAAQTGTSPPGATGKQYYERYVGSMLLKKAVVVPMFLAGFILFLYLLGKFLAAGVGRFLWNATEHLITQLPIIRTVYSSVKQVTDFFFGESDIEFNRVVAVQYPRQGIWSVGFVTGESMSTIRQVASEPILSVLMPTSPVPGTGFTISVRKSETVDLDIPIDQALQFVVSCGVVIPDAEIQQKINDRIAEATTERVAG